MSDRKTKGSRQSLSVTVQNTPRGSSRLSMGPGSMSMSSRTNVRSQGMLNARPAGELAMLSKKSVESVRDSRNKEKGDLSHLNQKLAERIDQMKFMEGQLAQMKMELDKWKAMKMFDDSKIKDVVTDEIDELREEIKRINEINSKYQTENMRLKDELNTLKEDMSIIRKQKDDEENLKEKMIRANENLELENKRLQNANNSLEHKNQQLLEQMNGMRDDLERLGDDLQDSRRQHLDEANNCLALREDLEFKYEIKDEECEELKRLIKQLQSIEPDYSKMWEGQFKESLMQLQAECDDRIKRHMDDVTRNYELKLATMQANMPRDTMDSSKKGETKTLKSEISNLTSKINDLERQNASLRQQLDDLNRKFEQECQECEREKEELRQLVADERQDKQDVQDQLDELSLTNDTLQNEILVYGRLVDTGLGGALASQGNYQTRGGSMMSQAILGGGGGGYGAGGSGGGSGSGVSGGGGSSSQSSNPKSPPKKAQAPADKAQPKKKPDNVSESSGKMSVTKSSSCGVVIEDISTDGSFIQLVNNTGKDFALTNMKIKRTFANRGKPSAEFSFKSGQSIRGKGKLKIYSYRFADDADQDHGDLVSTESALCKTWGFGTSECSLLDDKGKVLSSYNTKMT